jgi:hydrogenase maturation protein HypF
MSSGITDVVASVAGSSAERVRRSLVVSGLVQGVGFRPFVYRLASELGLSGRARNTTAGLCVEVEGPARAIDEFVHRVRSEPPPHAVIRRVTVTSGVAIGVAGFSIESSEVEGIAQSQVPQDLAPCPECTRELLDPTDRRYRYPFISCTQCGPRFTVIRSMPYDRANTTMAGFALCPECLREYSDPGDRRFHAEPIACPVCGPQLALWDPDGRVLTVRDNAMMEAAAAILQGRIVAVKAVGGFHLVVDARSESAVRELRRRKQRPEKPLAVLCGSLEMVRTICDVSEVEASLLCSREAPIVLLRAQRSALAPPVAPGNPYLGVMLPPSPLHVVLMQTVRSPVVATSGNRSDEPICTREDEAIERFRGIADLLLVHDRPIARQVDDSVVRVINGQGTVLRLGRGYAPLVVSVQPNQVQTLGVGGGYKNTVAMAVGEGIVLSQHVGSLGNADGRAVFHRTVADLTRLHSASPAVAACDLHPDDAAAREGRVLGYRMIRVQHHYAHVLSCMAEHELDGPVLGVAWDGTGYGADGTIWGGEFLVVDRTSWRRVGHLRQFRLPGGDCAVREPRRAAWGVLFELFGERVTTRDDFVSVKSLPPSERTIIARMLARGINSPVTSSAGRLFDAVSALVGIRQVATFEGQAAMALEFAADESPPLIKGGGGDLQGAGEPYPIGVEEQAGIMVVDWEPTVRAILDDRARGVSVPRMARGFHDALVEAIVRVAHRIGEERVVLTGGCFQNRYLTEQASHRLTSSGFAVYRHRLVPPNDGGIALGQAVAAYGKASPPSPPLSKGGKGGLGSEQ